MIFRSDPLLLAARVLIFVFLAGLALTFVFGVVGFLASIAAGGKALFWNPELAAWPPVLGAILMLGALLMLAEAAWLVLEMIAAVPAGEAFTASNIKRLERIAWLVIGLQIVGFIAGLLGRPIAGDINGFDVGVSLSPGGLAVALLLFVLARVFRQGAAMQTDLEGTV